MRATEVRHDMNVKKREKQAVFDRVLKAVHSSILRRADIGGERLVYRIPTFFAGLPLLKMDECVCHVLESLQNDGYTVRFTAPNSVYVSWDANETKQVPKLSQKDIVESGKRAATTYSKKKGQIQTVVRIQPNVDILTNNSKPVTTTKPIRIPVVENRVHPHPGAVPIYPACSPAIGQKPIQYAGNQQYGIQQAWVQNPRRHDMLAWEAFEASQPINLLQPPIVTGVPGRRLQYADSRVSVPSASLCATNHIQKQQQQRATPQSASQFVNATAIGRKGGLILDIT